MFGKTRNELLAQYKRMFPYALTDGKSDEDLQEEIYRAFDEMEDPDDILDEGRGECSVRDAVRLAEWGQVSDCSVF